MLLILSPVFLDSWLLYLVIEAFWSVILLFNLVNTAADTAWWEGELESILTHASTELPVYKSQMEFS